MKRFFASTEFYYEWISEPITGIRFFAKRINDSFEGLANDEEETYFYYPNGIESFVGYLNEEKDTLHPVVFLEGEAARH